MENRDNCIERDAIDIFSDYPDVVNVTQLSEMLGFISEKTACKLLREKKIAHFRIGRAYRIPKVYVIDYITNTSLC